MFLLEMILLLQLVHYNVDGKHYLVETADENNSLEENSPGGGQVTAFVSDQMYKSIRKNTKNWYTIDALGAIFDIFDNFDTFDTLNKF